jgi:hypothetical protein
VKKHAVLLAMFKRLAIVYAKVEHVEDCQVVMLDQQRELMAQIEVMRADRERFISLNRQHIETIGRLIAGKDALLRALGVQEYQRLQRLSSTPLAPAIELDEQTALNLARAYGAIDGARS